MDKSQIKVAKEFGFNGLIEGSEQPKMTYYTKDGRPLKDLPADAYSMRRYLTKGFTLTPPVAAMPVAPVEATEPEPTRRKVERRKRRTKREITQ